MKRSSGTLGVCCLQLSLIYCLLSRIDAAGGRSLLSGFGKGFFGGGNEAAAPSVIIVPGPAPQPFNPQMLAGSTPAPAPAPAPAAPPPIAFAQAIAIAQPAPAPAPAAFPPQMLAAPAPVPPQNQQPSVVVIPAPGPPPCDNFLCEKFNYFKGRR